MKDYPSTIIRSGIMLLLALISSTLVAQNYYGTWKGSATQPGANISNWTVAMKLSKQGSTVDFPSLGCGGALAYTGKEGNAFIFREALSYGVTKCMPGMSVRFSLTSPTTMNWEEIDAGGTALAYGTLTRDPLPDVHIVVTRSQKYAGCTQGEVTVNGKSFSKTLELRFDNAKKDSSSIPVGNYRAKLRYSSGKSRWVIELQNIYPHVYEKVGKSWRMKTVSREQVQIHAGDYPIKTGVNLQGCVLVGNSYTGCGFTDSKTTFNSLLDEYFGGASQPDASVKVTVSVLIDY
ncbi:hypothetical protein HB364_16300 [Pseudoflavitalea sp. X16]|uniref:DUF5675 family protein n=1 Tax=Paraflavitalea devenefica TaxID=2716334 RepID=UPI00141EC5A5|nr:DUF5675 family protein [Paraflavitalea devenefica]NII26652.1 hypothetical protein [Paraflavitalea devenefica]